MFLLFGQVPYLTFIVLVQCIAAIAIYVIAAADTFANPRTGTRSNWSSRLWLPIITAILSPLLTTVELNHLSTGEQFALAAPVGVGILFTILLESVLRRPRYFFRMQVPIGRGDFRARRITPLRICLLLGVALIVWSGLTAVMIPSFHHEKDLTRAPASQIHKGR